MNAPERRAGDPLAPVTRSELEAALGIAVAPIRVDVAALRADFTSIRADFATLHDDVAGLRADGVVLRANVDTLRGQMATKADVQAMGLRIVMWTGGLFAVFVAVMGWLVGTA